MRAGLPATTAYGGTDATTTAPAPTIAPRPIVIPGRMVALAPIDAPSFTTVAQERLRPPPAAREAVVRERRVGADEDVVLDPHAVPELDAAFHRDAIADDDVVLDERVIADVAVGADARAGQHVRERPDARARPDRSSSRRSPADARRLIGLPHAAARRSLAARAQSSPNVNRRCTIASGRPLVFSNARHAYAPTTDSPSAFSAPKPAISSTVGA